MTESEIRHHYRGSLVVGLLARGASSNMLSRKADFWKHIDDFMHELPTSILKDTGGQEYDTPEVKPTPPPEPTASESTIPEPDEEKEAPGDL